MIAVRPTLGAAAAMRTASVRAAAPAATAAAATAAAKALPALFQTRSFSVLPRLRPTSMLAASSVFRAPVLSQTTTTATSIAPEAAAATMAADLVHPASISRHPALAGLASQIRCGPRPTMAGATRLIQKRRHGFLSRIRTKNGRKTLMRRRAKGRKRLAS